MSMLTPYGTTSMNPVERIRRDFSRLFGDTGFALSRFADDDFGFEAGGWSPAADIREHDDHFLVQVDVPGVEPKDIDVTIDSGVLTIRGERSFAREEGNGNGQFRRTERAWGTFVRRFALPNTVDVDKVKATNKNGVLTVKVPKSESSRSRRITVQ